MSEVYFRGYVVRLAVQLAIAALRRSVVGISSKWSVLVETATDRYRPECHYMRGPGPKWFAKHVVVSNQSSLNGKNQFSLLPAQPQRKQRRPEFLIV
jgi:hypothetical protein